jgi:hypothetical protein
MPLYIHGWPAQGKISIMYLLIRDLMCFADDEIIRQGFQDFGNILRKSADAIGIPQGANGGGGTGNPKCILGNRRWHLKSTRYYS